MLGIGALVYSSAADWFATLNHDAEISGYAEEVEALPDGIAEEELSIAQEYNAHLPQGVLRDPYSTAADAEAETAAYRAYEEVLRVSDRGVIGELGYPRLGIVLPVYHGTDDEVLSRGVGHLYGSSLPVGGPSTHAALTSHSGLLNASLFTPLPDARVGDAFTVSVLGETRYYEVDRIETVLPEETESLSIVEGEDYVTLITCTPIGVNSHRLLVRGSRVPAPDGGGAQASGIDGRSAGFPWWAVAFVGGSAVTAYLLFAPSRKRPGARPRRPRSAGPEETT
ncbi:class C sortase [Leucobacter weissii]|uniref:Class C sortase n=2 Tax=Leucobacter weissii TaxID=1983706 RepID=A0A939MJ65_9MICO|nr:class C sortase [Leucobacter weissii]